MILFVKWAVMLIMLSDMPCPGFADDSSLSFNHTAGVIFVPETSVILSSAVHSTWISIPFPTPPALDVSHLDLLFRELQHNLSYAWRFYRGEVCGQDKMTDVYLNVTYLSLKGIEYEQKQILDDLKEMMDRARTFLKHTGTTASSRERRWIKPVLAGAATAIVLAPILKQGFCHLFSFFGFCDGNSAVLDHLTRHAAWLEESVKTIVLESGEKLHLLGHSLNRTQNRMTLLAKDSNANFHMLRDALKKFLSETDNHSWNGGACYSKHRTDAYRDALMYSTAMVNFTSVFSAIRSELAAFKLGLHNFGYILDDALSSLTRGQIPASLIPPETLIKVVETSRLAGYQEAIPRDELSAYYSFELVEATVITNSSVNVLIKIPLHYMPGLHHVYRAVPIPQPINGDPTATQYQFEKSFFVISDRKDTFAEISDDVLTNDCSGNHRLRLCTKPFAMSRSGDSGCLSSLYFDLVSQALKLCPQIVVALPELPRAEYLDDSTYLVTARSDDYQLFNYSSVAKTAGQRIAGCRSCLLRPSCSGRIENPSGSLVLTPDPSTCSYENGMVVYIQPHPLLKTLFDTLKTVEKGMLGMELPSHFQGKAHTDLLDGLRLNLLELPEGTIDEGELEKVARPFAESILKDHAPLHWKVYHSVFFDYLKYLCGIVGLGCLCWILYQLCLRRRILFEIWTRVAPRCLIPLPRYENGPDPIPVAPMTEHIYSRIVPTYRREPNDSVTLTDFRHNPTVDDSNYETVTLQTLPQTPPARIETFPGSKRLSSEVPRATPRIKPI